MKTKTVLSFIFISLITNHSFSQNGLILFDTFIKPVFDQNCIACHNSDDIQGGLDLSTVEGIKHGGAFGAVIQPGSADESELINRITLPIENELAMPPAGKERVIDDHIKLIRWWVESGASFDQTVREDDIPDDISAILTKKIAAVKEKKELEDIVPALAEDIQSVRDRGFEVRQISIGNPLLDVSVDPLKKQITKDDINALSQISQNIAWLKLSNCGLNDELCMKLPIMPNCKKINLSQNKITAVSVQHLLSLTKLEVLNLYQTNVGDDGIDEISKFKRLHTAYLWKTNLTNDGIQRLLEQKPSLKIIGILN